MEKAKKKREKKIKETLYDQSPKQTLENQNVVQIQSLFGKFVNLLICLPMHILDANLRKT